MTIPIEILELAEKGGWKNPTFLPPEQEPWERVVLDADFWKALIKQLKLENERWEMYLQRYSRAVGKIPFGVLTAEAYGTLFAYLVLTGGDTTEKGFNLEAMARGGVPTTEETSSPIEKFWNEILSARK